ncbi:sensor histidine kinase [Parachryseolinea silvisoli]|uniref:sensor histidine kinase n=1 Tax=Parachryseolinea silvisoli TaxID=2873601 RepID=UPI002265810A|nr:HAMP domain-containing sensor histidine kinase [Parachryseolinea silvisoli]MCD9013936.1 HAMP domain-containing histidine kinase [Parachryseolinea silvisoli]
MKELSDEALLNEVRRRMSLSEKTILEQQDMLQEMQRLNARLEQSEAMKSHFISNIKNEINNPLASILALTQTIVDKQSSLPADVQRNLKLIYNEAYALDFQMTNIMTAAEIEAGQVTPQWVEVGVSQVLEQVIQSFETVREKKGVPVRVGGDTAVQFVTDGRYFRIILANLVSNAIKFSNGNDAVVISLRITDEQLVISITNAGSDIPQEDVARIFDRFTQLDTGTVKKYQGHGLGLSVIRSLVELLDGSIAVTTQIPGVTFTVRLPVKASEEGFRALLGGDGSEILFDEAF